MAEASRIFREGLLDRQVCVVSGAGTGLGKATALELARLGATVVGCGRRQEPLDETVAEIEAGGRHRVRTALDIRDEEAVDAFIDEVVEQHGRIDTLVNNAGGQFLSPAEAITPKGFRTVIELNVVGTWLMTHAAATKAFIPQGEGKVLSVTLSPHQGMPGMVHSGAARAAVENMMRTLSVEWARFGIRLVALAAGQFGTETMRTKYPKEVVEGVPRTVPLAAPGHRGGVGVARRLPGLARGRLLLGDRDHDRRRPRQLVRRLAADRGDRRGGRAAGGGAAAEGLALVADRLGDQLSKPAVAAIDGWSPSRALRGHAAELSTGDVQDLAMDVVGELRAEEQDRPRRLLGLGGAAERDDHGRHRAHLLGDAQLDLLAAGARSRPPSSFAAVSRVSTKPNATALQLILKPPHSLATVLVRPTTPAFADE